MTNQTLPLNSSRIKTCEYDNCKNQFLRRSNNHKVSLFLFVLLSHFNIIFLIENKKFIKIIKLLFYFYLFINCNYLL